MGELNSFVEEGEFYLKAFPEAKANESHQPSWKQLRCSSHTRWHK